MIEVMRSTITGEYPADDDAYDADCIIGQSYGYRGGILPNIPRQPGPINEDLATFVERRDESHALPWLLQGEVADALQQDHEPELVVRTHTDPDKYLDSANMLVQAQGYMDEHGLYRPLIVAQRHHAHRVAAQAVRLGMRPYLPPDLPGGFDPESEQIWTRSRGKWIARELAGLVVLKALGRL